jgi:hypothetical protein
MACAVCERRNVVMERGRVWENKKEEQINVPLKGLFNKPC